MDKQAMGELYRTMLRIRLFEEEVILLNQKQMVPGFIHSYIGEEATAVGACATLGEDDYIVSTHRGHGHIIAKGCDMKLAMAELFGKVDGYCHGKGGSMHIADARRGVIGANGIVGAGIPIACGVGLAAQLEKESRVVLCFFGDGASNQGTFHESLNLASVWRLPVVFICENNLYAISVSQEVHQKVHDVSERATAYRVPGYSIDGNDVLGVIDTVSKAVNHARDGDGPSLVEAKTYRWRGHSEADPVYGTRSREEVEGWKEKCPIKRFREYLLSEVGMTESELSDIDTAVQREISEAVAYAQASENPPPAAALDDVYFGSRAI
jgi:pyruvate dehydrogenase E1 component alpha subunit